MIRCHGIQTGGFFIPEKIIVVPHEYWSLKDFFKNDKICPKNCKKISVFFWFKKITPLIRNVHRQMLLKDIGFWDFSRCWGRLRCVEKFKNLQKVTLVGCSNVWLIFTHLSQGSPWPLALCDVNIFWAFFSSSFFECFEFVVSTGPY